MVRQHAEHELTKLTEKLKGAREVLDQEVAKRGEVETQLQRYMSEADLTFEKAPVVDVIINAEGRIVKANHAAVRFLRQPLSLVQGSHFCTAFNCSRACREDKPNHSCTACDNCPIRLAFKGELNTEPRLFPMLSDGRGRRHRLLVSSYAFTHGKEKLVLLSLEREPHDRSKQRELQRLFKLDCLGILARSIALDVSQYVEAIREGVDGALKCSDVEEAIREQLTSAREAVVKASDLSTELLTVARVNNQSVQTVDLAALLDAVVDGFKQKLSTKVDLECQEALWPIEGDAHLIAQALKHVLRNAFEAAKNDGEVVIRAMNVVEPMNNKLQLLSGRYVKVIIEDTGPGIPDHEREKILEPFYTTKEDKHGLGLSSVCLISRQQGGTFLVDSEVGRGTTATFYLLCEIYPQAERVVENKGNSGRLLAFSPSEVSAHELFRRAVEIGEAGE